MILNKQVNNQLGKPMKLTWVQRAKAYDKGIKGRGWRWKHGKEAESHTLDSTKTRWVRFSVFWSFQRLVDWLKKSAVKQNIISFCPNQQLEKGKFALIPAKTHKQKDLSKIFGRAKTTEWASVTQHGYGHSHAHTRSPYNKFRQRHTDLFIALWCPLLISAFHHSLLRLPADTSASQLFCPDFRLTLDITPCCNTSVWVYLLARIAFVFNVHQLCTDGHVRSKDTHTLCRWKLHQYSESPEGHSNIDVTTGVCVCVNIAGACTCIRCLLHFSMSPLKSKRAKAQRETLKHASNLQPLISDQPIHPCFFSSQWSLLSSWSVWASDTWEVYVTEWGGAGRGWITDLSHPHWLS